MKLALFIYLASILDKFSFIISVIAFIFAVAVGVLTLFYFTCKSDESLFGEDKTMSKITLKSIKIFVPILIISGILAIVTPSKQTAYLMAGAYIGTQIATSDVVNARLEKIIKIIDLNLDKQIEDLQKDLK